jgi:hypothetical protein
MTLIAVATAVTLVAVISGGAAAPAFAALKGVIGPALARRMLVQAAGAVWRTVVRTVNGESLERVFWDEAGQLVVRFVREGARVEETRVGGVTNEGLDPARASEIASAVHGLIAGGEYTVPTVVREVEQFGAVMDAARRFDLAGELIRRGLVRMDTGNESLLRQQPTLLRAARDALLDDRTSGGPARGAAYRSRVQALSSQLALP